MHNHLFRHVRKFLDLSESDELSINSYFNRLHLKKKEFLIQEGKICKDLFFVEKGCLRMFFINNKAVEQVVQFAIDGWWISDYHSFMNNTPSGYNIQCIEKSEIVSIDNQRFEELLKEFPQMERYFRIILQKAVAASQHRSKLLYEMTKEEFYIHFSTTFPAFMQRVPQYMIASYLGLTPEYLSELRKKNFLNQFNI